MTLPQKLATMAHLLITRPYHASLYLRFRKYTMIAPQTYIANLMLVQRHRNGI